MTGPPPEVMRFDHASSGQLRRAGLALRRAVRVDLHFDGHSGRSGGRSAMPLDPIELYVCWRHAGSGRVGLFSAPNSSRHSPSLERRVARYTARCCQCPGSVRRRRRADECERVASLNLTVQPLAGHESQCHADCQRDAELRHNRERVRCCQPRPFWTWLR